MRTESPIRVVGVMETRKLADDQAAAFRSTQIGLVVEVETPA